MEVFGNKQITKGNSDPGPAPSGSLGPEAHPVFISLVLTHIVGMECLGVGAGPLSLDFLCFCDGEDEAKALKTALP